MYPDWIEDRFGDDIPDWAEERWGDDDDDQSSTYSIDNRHLKNYNFIDRIAHLSTM